MIPTRKPQPYTTSIPAILLTPTNSNPFRAGLTVIETQPSSIRTGTGTANHHHPRLVRQ